MRLICLLGHVLVWFLVLAARGFAQYTPPVLAPPEPDHQVSIAPIWSVSPLMSAGFPESFFGDGWAQWAMALTGLLALGVSLWGVRLLYRNLEVSNKIAATSGAANDAARDAVEATRFATVTQLRPWVCPKTAQHEYREKVEVGGETYDVAYLFSIIWQNAGQSPAVKCKFLNAIRVVNSGEPAPSFIGPTSFGHGVISPIGESSGSPKFLVGSELSGFLQGQLDVILYGGINYRDALDENSSRLSEACFRIVRNGTGVRPNGEMFPIMVVTVDGPQNNVV